MLYLPKDHLNSETKHFKNTWNFWISSLSCTSQVWGKNTDSKVEPNYVYNCSKEKESIEWKESDCTAVRTDKEIKGFNRPHIADRVAMVKF